MLSIARDVVVPANEVTLSVGFIDVRVAESASLIRPGVYASDWFLGF